MQNELHLYERCPLCDSEAIADHRSGDCTGHPLYQPPITATLRWKKCEACGHVFRNGYYSEEACTILFSRTQPSQRIGHDLERQRLVSARIVEKLLPFQSSGEWLDVGFGNGSLLFTAQEYGFTPFGLDLRADNVKKLAGFGIGGACQDLTQFDAPGRFSVISMADVLEHMPFPPEGLRAALRLLAPGGALFLSMPNSESMVWRALDARKQNPYWGEVEHYHNFSRSRLYALLEEHGFEPALYGVSERYRACMEVVAVKPA
jgi:SAM-dependent methyltransferase